MTDTQIFEPDGRAIPYVEEGDSPVRLVLVPEPGEGRDALGVVAHYLVEEAGFHVVRIGFRGSSSDPHTVTLSERVEDLLAVLDQLGWEHAWIGGHGFGGTVARAAVAAHPDRANGLLLLGVEDLDIPLVPVLPVLILQGSDDEITPTANGERLQSTAPERASVKNIGGAGHLFPLTHVFETAVTIEEYLDWD